MSRNNSEYQKNYMRKHYLDNKEYYKKKSHERNKRVREELLRFTHRYKLYVGCSVCGYNKNAFALQFDHLEPKEKFKAVSQMISECYSLKAIKKEIRKCRVVCANCHAEYTHSRALST